MATYYVRPDGSDSNTGLGSTTALAWATFGKAFATGSPVVGGDIVYIAPGTYTESITINATSPTSEVRIIGNPTATQFTGVSAGFVRLSAYNGAGTSVTFAQTHLITGTSKNYYTFENIHFDANHNQTNGGVYFITSTNIKLKKCLFTNYFGMSTSFGGHVYLTTPASVAANYTIEQCIFGANLGGKSLELIQTGTAVANDTTVIRDCLFVGHESLRISNLTSVIYNCSFFKCDIGVLQPGGTANSIVTVQNCLFANCGTGLSGTSGFNAQTYCRFVGNTTNLSNWATSVTSQTTGNGGVDYGYAYLVGLNPLPSFGSYSGSPNTSFGNSTSAPIVDLYDATWSGVNPDAGAITNKSMTGIGYYFPAERNASAITIAPASTSQSVELYLGATGLTFSTSGLAAYYVRNQSAPVAITLVTQTPTGAWSSGGFAEISSSLVPGVYRLDLPDAAVTAGADDVTVVVRGASGTNGAVMTIKLSSGGLTAAQTAQAVLDAVASTHNNIGSIGASIQDKAGYSLSTSQSFSTTGSVGSVTGNVAGNVTGTVGGVAGNVTGNIAGSVATVASPDNIIDGVWDEQRTGHTAAGSFGEKLQTNALADEMLARDLGSGLNAGTAEERTVRSALRALRNKVNVGSSQMVVKKEDDTTDAWTATVTTTAVSSNVSGIDPN